MLKARVRRWARLGMLALVTMAGTMYTSCGMTDLKDNIAAGSLGYVKSSATNFWAALIPEWKAVLAGMQQGT